MTRRKIDLNWQQIEAMCQIMATREEVAHVFKCSGRAIENRCLADQGMTWSIYFEKHSAGGRVSIRRDLFRESKEGNVAASIFLAKNYLGMGDKQELNVTVQNKAEDLTDAELMAIAKHGRLGTVKAAPVTPSPN